MSGRTRLTLFIISGAGLFLVLLWGMHGLPEFGHYPGPYGVVLNRVAVPERHVTNVVTSVNFDYRGLDTMGEEYILFAALVGLTVLLRSLRGEKEDTPREASPGRMVTRNSDGVRWAGLGLTGITNLYGSYIVLHGQLTPGGGFQGGAILGTAALLAYLATGYKAFQRFSPASFTEFVEAAGAGAYALIGLGTLAVGAAFLQNVIPLGKTGDLSSSGTIATINFFVGVEVSTGFVLMFSEFLKETRKSSEKADEKPAQAGPRAPGGSGG